MRVIVSLLHSFGLLHDSWSRVIVCLLARNAVGKLDPGSFFVVSPEQSPGPLPHSEAARPHPQERALT